MPIVDLAVEDIDRVVVERSGEGAEPLELVRGVDGWSIASSAGYPAQADKVQDLLETVMDIRVRRPIATKAVNHNALHVGSDDWGKKLRLDAGERHVELVLGAATGRVTHVRRADEDHVYSAQGLSEWTIKDRPSSYWEPEVVDIDLDRVTAVSIEPRGGDTITIDRGEHGWTYEGPVPTAPHAMIDPDKLDRLAAAACTLRLRQPVGTQALPEHGFDPPAARVTVTITDGDASTSYAYDLGDTVDGHTFLRLPDDPFVVTVSEYSTAELTEVSLQGLLLSPEG
jgi:hypothetical protein